MILASTSPYRRRLLERLGLAFRCEAPGVDERVLDDETGASLAIRLSRAKASAVAARIGGCLVIGSDQVAELDGRTLGKPGDHAHARRQLQQSSGRHVRFQTGVALFRGSELLGERCVTTDVAFRTLDDAEIERYLQREQPYDCAGSFKCEALGIALFRELRSDDPTALEGLPLIATCELLRDAGVVLP